MKIEKRQEKGIKSIDRSNGVRHPIITLFFVTVIFILILDFLFANLYTLINGYPWAEREENQKKIIMKKNREIERTYRIHSDIYNHDLAKNKCVNNAKWGNITYKVCTNSLGFKDNTVRIVPISSEKYRIVDGIYKALCYSW